MFVTVYVIDKSLLTNNVDFFSFFIRYKNLIALLGLANIM